LGGDLANVDDAGAGELVPDSGQPSLRDVSAVKGDVEVGAASSRELDDFDVAARTRFLSAADALPGRSPASIREVELFGWRGIWHLGQGESHETFDWSERYSVGEFAGLEKAARCAGPAFAPGGDERRAAGVGAY
jgi:hypothetical protein